MILDQNLTFCTSLSHAGNAVVQFTDTLDMRAASDLADGGGSGSGRELALHVHVTEAFAGGTAGTFQLFSCIGPTINVITPPIDQVVAEGQYAAGSLAVNAHLFVPLQKTLTRAGALGPAQTQGRYLIGQFVPTGTFTTGKFTARLALNPSIGSHHYPRGLTIL